MSTPFGHSLAALTAGVPSFTLPLALLGQPSLASWSSRPSHSHSSSRVIAPPSAHAHAYAQAEGQHSLFAHFPAPAVAKPSKSNGRAGLGFHAASPTRFGVSSLFGLPSASLQRREAHTLAPAHSVTDGTFERLAARQSAALSEEVEADSDGTRQEDLQMLKESEPATQTTPQAQMSQEIAASLGMGGSASMGLRPPLRQSVPPSSAPSFPAVSSSSLSAPSKRRSPSIVEALSMAPEQLVYGLTLSEREAEASYRLQVAQAAEQGVDLEALNEAQSGDSFLHSLVEFATAPKRREKQHLASRPHTHAEYFVAGGLAEDSANYNTLLRICKAKGLYEEGMAHFRRMQQLGLPLDPHTFTALVSLCSIRSPDAAVNSARLARAWQLLEEYKAAHSGRVEESFWNALLCTAGKLAGRAEAEKVLARMKKEGVAPSQITYTALIDLCRKAPTPENLQRAEFLFNRMKAAGGALEPDTHAYNAMIRLAGETRRADLAIALFDEMRSRHYAPDHYTYAHLMHACSKTAGYAAHAAEYFAEYVSLGFRPSTSAYNILLHSFSREGDVAHASQVWALMREGEVRRDAVTYNTMLNVIAESMERDYVRARPASKGDTRAEAQLPKEELLTKEERIQMSEALLAQMKQERVPIDTHTLNGVVKVVAKAGRLQRALLERERLFAEHPHCQMDFYSHKPIFDMYLKNARVARAVDYAQTMREAGFPPNANMYRTLLHAIEKSSKLSAAQRDELGQRSLRLMQEDQVPVPERFTTLFDPAAYGAMVRAQQAARLQADTVRAGPAGSFTQREDAMIRPAKIRGGSGRQGSQEQRFAHNPQLAVFKQKRQQRAADKKERAQGINPRKKRANQEAIGHYY